MNRFKACRRTIWAVDVSIAPEAEDAVTELLERVFFLRPAVYADAETTETIASVFPSAISSGQRRELAGGLDLIRRCGIDPGPAKVLIRKIRSEDWAESWKRHFKPIEINGRLLIKPSWSRRRAKPGQAVVILDPGLSFGTGQHPTTHFCLRELSRSRRSREPQSFLDAGTGSGILAVAAAKLGYNPVHAFDFDADAVRIARENAAQNGVAVSIVPRDLAKMPVSSRQRYHVVCANLINDVLIGERRKLIARMKTRGTLVLAGILTRQFEAVRRAFESEGLQLARKRTAGEWTSGSFVFSSRD